MNLSPIHYKFIQILISFHRRWPLRERCHETLVSLWTYKYARSWVKRRHNASPYHATFRWRFSNDDYSNNKNDNDNAYTHGDREPSDQSSLATNQPLSSNNKSSKSTSKIVNISIWSNVFDMQESFVKGNNDDNVDHNEVQRLQVRQRHGDEDEDTPVLDIKFIVGGLG